MITNKTATFAPKIISWQRQFGRRDLPWTRLGWGYGVWISEVMLQQTQVCTILFRFEKFIKKFPTIQDLAAAAIDDVLGEWSGLGYYARAKNLHLAAKQIVSNHSGQFPENFSNVLALPGIGKTTAGAILSLAFQQRYPILDGNVKRIFKRYFSKNFLKEIKEKELWRLAEDLLPNLSKDIHDYNQGLMDLGALICTFRNPKCNSCPLKKNCDFLTLPQSVLEKNQMNAIKSLSRIRKNCILTAWIFTQNEKIFFQKVPKDLKIWQDLYFFPVTFEKFDFSAIDHLKEQESIVAKNSIYLRHLCTHMSLDIHALIYKNISQEVFACLKNLLNLSGQWYSFDEFKTIGLSSPTFKLLKKIDINF